MADIVDQAVVAILAMKPPKRVCTICADPIEASAEYFEDKDEQCQHVVCALEELNKKKGYEACRADVVAWLSFVGVEAASLAERIERGDADGFIRGR